MAYACICIYIDTNRYELMCPVYHMIPVWRLPLHLTDPFNCLFLFFSSKKGGELYIVPKI